MEILTQSCRYAVLLLEMIADVPESDPQDETALGSIAK